MCHSVLSLSSFWLFLLDIDDELAKATRDAGCPHCRARLHTANYPRKPRGAPLDLPDGYDRRLSLCCSRDGCRRRATPPSARFLGRKVYLGAVVTIVTAMRQGPTPTGMRKLRALFGADRRTVERWRVFWQHHFPTSDFWREKKASAFAETPRAVELPRRLLQEFREQGEFQSLERLLEFFSPVTVPAEYSAMIHDF